VGDEGATAAWLEPAGEPVSAVICLDDSASMGYRFQGLTRLRAAARQASKLIANTRRFEPGSEFAIISGSSSREAGAWTADLHGAVRELDGLRVACHDRPAAALLHRACRRLVDARNRRHEIYLFTDFTTRSWDQDLGPFPKGLAAVYVLDVGQDENHNVSLSWPDLPEYAWPAGVPNVLTLRIRSGELPAEPVVDIAVDGQPRGRQATDPLPADSEREIAVTLPAMDKGTHTVTLELGPQDALEADNRRFACVAVGEIPHVLLIADDPDNEVAAMVAAMIAPTALAPAELRYATDLRRPEELGRIPLDGVPVVILADVTGLDAGTWALLAKYVEGGGTAVVVPGPSCSPAGYQGGQLILPAEIRSVATCSEPVTLAATDLAQPLLRPFADDAIDSMNDRPVFRRLEVGPVDDAVTIVAPFSDGKPALLTRRVGRGEVVLLAFSPAREWSLFGSQAAPMIVLLQTLLANRAPTAERVASLTAGRGANRWFAHLTQATVAFDGPGGAGREPLGVRDGRVTLPTTYPGTYRLTAAGAAGRSILDYSANIAEGESDLTRLSPQAVSSLFPAGLACVVGRADDLVARGPSTRSQVKWTIPLLLLLVATLFAETLFSNRFYGSRRASPDSD
jgi:hypothetical protein